MAGSVQSRLRVTRQQILAFRRRVGALDERMPKGCGLAAAGGVGRPAGQHAESRAALVARAGRRRRVVDVGGSLARPAVGASVQHLCRPEARLRAVLAREASRQRQGPPSGRAHGRAVARPSRRQADDRPRGRARARRRQRDQVRRDDGHGRDPLGGRACADGLDGRRCRGRTGRRLPRARSTLPPRLRARDRQRVRPLGRNLARGRRPTHSPRSRDRCCRSDRRSATSGCSRRTSRRCAPPRRPPRPRACCRAAMPTSCSTEQSGSFSFRGRTSGSVSGRPACGRARSSSTARSAEPGDGRSTRCGSTPGHVSRARRATRSRPRPPPCRFQALDRRIEVVWDA